MRTRTHVPHCVDSCQSVGVTVCNPPWMSWPHPQNDSLTVAHSSERMGRMTGFVLLSSQGSWSTPSWCRVWIGQSSVTGSSISKLLMCPFSPLHPRCMTSSTPRRTERWGEPFRSRRVNMQEEGLKATHIWTRRRSDMQFPHFCSLLSRLHSSAGGAEPVKSKRSSDNRLGVAPTTSRYPFIKKTLFHQDIQSRSV